MKKKGGWVTKRLTIENVKNLSRLKQVKPACDCRKDRQQALLKKKNKKAVELLLRKLVTYFNKFSSVKTFFFFFYDGECIFKSKNITFSTQKLQLLFIANSKALKYTLKSNGNSTWNS